MIKCQEVTVKFLNVNHHGERIRALEVPGCSYIETFLNRQGTVLEISFKHADHCLDTVKTLKTIIFNFVNVKEFACEGILE